MNLLNLNEDNYETDIDDLFDVDVYVGIECDRARVYSGLYGRWDNDRGSITRDAYCEDCRWETENHHGDEYIGDRT